jgi:predicted translin family RNA/ssDNA-binding protein
MKNSNQKSIKDSNQKEQNNLIKIDRSTFDKLSANYDSYDKLREELIIQSRAVLKEAKQTIFTIHRNDNGDLSTNIQSLVKSKESIDRIISKNPLLSSEGSYSQAIQEFVEALSYYSIITKRILPSNIELCVDEEDYLLGICDLPGELVRRSVNKSIEGDTNTAIEMRNFVSELYSILLRFNPRNGSLRKKIDSVKWELMKLEDLILSNKQIRK